RQLASKSCVYPYTFLWFALRRLDMWPVGRCGALPTPPVLPPQTIARTTALHCGISTVLLSALGQKQTCRAHAAMSALPLKADITSLPRYVRFVPKAEPCTAARLGRSLFEQVRRYATYLCPAASRISAVIVSGCDMRERWLAFTSIVFAPMRFAMKRWRSGLIVRSSVETA